MTRYSQTVAMALTQMINIILNIKQPMFSSGNEISLEKKKMLGPSQRDLITMYGLHFA